MTVDSNNISNSKKEIVRPKLEMINSTMLHQNRQTRWDHGLRINHLDDVTCGLLPTLQVLASRGCECQGSVCIVPIDLSTDSASHLQITLLEAYCREIQIEVVKISLDDLKFSLGNHNYNKRDLSCVLVPRDMIYTNFYQNT